MGFKDFFKKRNNVSGTKNDPQVVENKSDSNTSTKDVLTALFDSNKSISSVGDFYYTQGNMEEALRHYELATSIGLKIDPNMHKIWLKKGLILSNLRRNEEAIEAFEKVIEIKSDFQEAWVCKGLSLSVLGKKEEALKAYEKAIEIKPDYHASWYNKGNVLKNLGQKEEAIKAYEKAIEIKPDYQKAWFNKGNVLDDLGRKEEALKAYEKAIEIKPDYHEAWYNKGNVLFDIERYEDAVKCYNKVKELNPESKNVEEKLAIAETKHRESSLETLKLEIEDARKYIFVPESIEEVVEKRVSQKVDLSRESLKKLLSEAKPVISAELDRNSFNLNEWYRSKMKIANEGNAHAFDVVLSFSDDFEIRRIEPVSINAGDKEELEIALKPMVKGNVPLEITAKYLDGKGENYKSKHAFWIDVKEFQELEKARELKPSSTLGAFRAVPRLFPEELAVQYKSIEYIGGGGFARVFKAKRQDEKQVAVKLPSSSDAVTGKSFISELMNWTGLEHENIVKVYEFNILPVPYFEMELCDCALSERQFPLDANSSAWIIFNICEGLKYAHSKSIIHQDLKPDNILLKEGVPKISDWGLSKVATTSRTSSLGGYTSLYAAPEQISKKFGKKDTRTDIWQVGIIFYEMTTGKTPFEGDDPVAIMSGIMMEDPELPSMLNPDAEKLDLFILKCLEKKQEMRYQSVSELQRDLAKFLRIDYIQSLKISISKNDLRRSAFYCGDLFIVHLKLGDLETAYKYASDLSHYAQDEIKDLTNEFCTQLEVRIDNGIHDVPEELMEKAEIIAHKVGLGFRK